MTRILSIFFALFLCLAQLEGAPARPAHIDPAVWAQVEPYVMPNDHPIKAKLDKLFSKTRVLLNAHTLAKAGFKKTKPGQFSKAIVSTNSHFKNYLFKMYSDEQRGLSDWQQWVDRASGAISAQESINRHGYQSYFVVPKKWIYVLPENPAPPVYLERKNFILVVEDMHILKKSDNYGLWKSASITPALLDALYILTQEQGLADSTLPFNIPFTKRGKIALIDLEINHKWTVPFERLTRYLSPAMRQYWEGLIVAGGPKS